MPTSTDALELGPSTCPCYELEAKPGTRFTHAHGDELERQADAMESYFELVVERLTGAGYRWYETANFCRASERSGCGTCAPGTTSLTGSGGTTSGSASAPSRRSPGAGGGTRHAWPPYMDALKRGTVPEREIEPLSHDVLRRERVMLGLRLDEPLVLGDLAGVVDGRAVSRLELLGLVQQRYRARRRSRSRDRGRFLGGGVTADLLDEGRR